MKKSILALSIALVASLGISSFAQNANEGQKSNKQKKERNDKEAKPEKNLPNPFEGLNLTADQQAKIEALKADQQKAKAEKKQQKDEQKKADKQKKQDGMKAMVAERQQQKREYLAKVKGILTSQQYVQFLENAYVEQGNNMKAQMKGNMSQRGNDKKDMNRGQRPQRQGMGQRPMQAQQK